MDRSKTAPSPTGRLYGMRLGALPTTDPRQRLGLGEIPVMMRLRMAAPRCEYGHQSVQELLRFEEAEPMSGSRYSAEQTAPWTV